MKIPHLHSYLTFLFSLHLTIFTPNSLRVPSQWSSVIKYQSDSTDICLCFNDDKIQMLRSPLKIHSSRQLMPCVWKKEPIKARENLRGSSINLTRSIILYVFTTFICTTIFDSQAKINNTSLIPPPFLNLLHTSLRFKCCCLLPCKINKIPVG